MDLIRWVWVVMALFFFIAEIFTAGFVLACFGVGALAAAVLAFLGTGLAWQLGAFVVVSIVAVVLSRPFAERVTGKQPEGVGVDRVLGKQAVVIEAIDPLSASGRVRVDREEWRADSVDGSTIAEGEMVEVLGVEGTRLRVRPIPR
jgi:membrane protein implicated in regulation of membrane protease activity